MFHHCARSHFFGPAAVPPYLLCAFFDVLVLALFLRADAL
jgi:hypothetical protein